MSSNRQLKDVSSKWAARYFSLAAEAASWSKDPSSKVGCVYVGRNGQILSTGFNGFPRGIEDSSERLNNRSIKYQYVVHAEKNGIYNACLNGVSLEGSLLFVSGLPICSECAKGIIQVGVSAVWVRKQDIDKSGIWEEQWKITKNMFLESGVEYTIIG